MSQKFATEFAARYRVDAAGCWIWTGHIAPTGYGRYGLLYAHRLSVELARGPIPDGMHVDHLCRVRACVNPDHLEVVTQQENNIRAGLIQRKELCINGHDLTDPANHYRRKNGGRLCKPCALDRARARRERQSA